MGGSIKLRTPLEYNVMANRKTKVDKLVTFINTNYYDCSYSQRILVDNTIYKEILQEDQKVAEVNYICMDISNNKLNSASLQDDKRFFHIAFSDYYKYKRSEQDELIFKIDNINGNYFISTGLYCGVINLGDKIPQIEIKTGYSDTLFKRMLNYCCGVYADTNTSKNSDENESIYSLLIQYIYLISLRKVANKVIPKKYVYLKERGYDINGNVDINEYIYHDIIAFDKKVTYQYIKRLEIQSIIDVLHAAMNCCKISQKNETMPSMLAFQNYLSELYSGHKPSKSTIKNARKDKCLNSSLYSDFKLPLEYAKILLDNNDLNSGDNKIVSGIGGFLVDASFLWEMYLCNLMRLHLKDWVIDSQSEFAFYEGTFFKKNNYPDFVLRHKETGAVYIIDAKFKRMIFTDSDVDNQDLQQLHSYSYYFHLNEGENFRGAGLIYPSHVEQPENIINEDSMFGLNHVGQRFAIFSIKDPTSDEAIVDNEKKFIRKLRKFLETQA